MQTGPGVIEPGLFFSKRRLGKIASTSLSYAKRLVFEVAIGKSAANERQVGFSLYG
jgi:hypothetical protein